MCYHVQMNQDKICTLNKLPQSKVKVDEKKVKKHYDQIRAASIQKKHPMARGLVGGKDAIEVNSQYDVFDFVLLSFRAHSAFSLRQTSKL